MGAFRFWVLLAVLTILLIPNSGPAAQGGSARPFTVVIGMSSDITTMDFHNEPDTTLSVARQIYESLAYVDDKLTLQPALATSWRLVRPTTWEFKLRRGVKFHNGDPFTAEDVKFSLDRIIAEGLPSGPKKYFLGWFKSVEVVDPFTVRIHTERPYAVTLRAITRGPWIYPARYFKRVGAQGFAQKPVGTGPFKFVERKVNQSMEMVANESYWKGKPAIDRVIFRVIPDEATQIAEVITGGVDVLTLIPPSRVPELRKAGIPVVTTDSVKHLYLGMNTHESPLNDVRIRRAIAHAIDADAMIKSILGGFAGRERNLLAKLNFGWNPNIPLIQYNPARAKQLLAEAYYPNGFRTTIESGPGQWPATTEISQAIAAYLGEVGIRVDVRVYTFSEYFQKYRATQVKGLFLWGDGFTLDADGHFTLNFTCPPGRGLYWCSSETDRLITEARFETDVQRREKLYWRVQEIMYNQMVAVPLWHYSEIAAVSKRIQWRPRGDTYMDVWGMKPAGSR